MLDESRHPGCRVPGVVAFRAQELMPPAVSLCALVIPVLLIALHLQWAGGSSRFSGQRQQVREAGQPRPGHGAATPPQQCPENRAGRWAGLSSSWAWCPSNCVSCSLEESFVCLTGKWNLR